MPYPIQNVNAFSEAELWFIYQQLIEINPNAVNGCLNQLQLFEVFNGTNSQGGASSLFETISGGDTPLANLLVDAISGNHYSVGNLLHYTNLYLNSVRTPVIISSTGSGTVAVQIHNISIANVGSAVGTITVDGTTVNLPAGAVVNYDAGGNNNRFAINKFGYNGTGTTLLIQYVS